MQYYHIQYLQDTLVGFRYIFLVYKIFVLIIIALHIRMDLLMFYSFSFRCLNRDRSGKILLNLCFSLLLMNGSFLLGATNIVSNRNGCAAIALFIHYFVLTSLTWMGIEATNMYQLLIHVFASSETHFLLKRCSIGWGKIYFR